MTPVLCLLPFALCLLPFAQAVTSPVAQITRQPCPVTVAVQDSAPPDPHSDPVRGYWYKSADGKLWAPAPQPGTVSTGVGSYWVRPAGAHLTFSVRRLDIPGPPVTSQEGSEYTSGFFYGGPNIPGEGCWEVTAAAGSSQVTFVAEIRYTFEVFAQRPTTRVTWSKDIGRLDARNTRLVVTAQVFEDPDTLTRLARGVRIHVSDETTTSDLYMEDARLEGTRGSLERWAGGQLPMIYGLDRVFNARGDAMSLLIVGQPHRYYFFSDKAPADFATLLLKAGDQLRALR